MFLIFALKRRLWVLVSEAVLTCTTVIGLSKNKKNITFFHLKILILKAMKLIFHRHVTIYYYNIIDIHYLIGNCE